MIQFEKQVWKIFLLSQKNTTHPSNHDCPVCSLVSFFFFLAKPKPFTSTNSDFHLPHKPISQNLLKSHLLTQTLSKSFTKTTLLLHTLTSPNMDFLTIFKPMLPSLQSCVIAIGNGLESLILCLFIS